MASITLIEAFGANATRTGDQVTIDFGDFPELTTPATATPSQLISALLQYWNGQTAWSDDKLKGIAPGFANTKQIVTTRGTDTVSQISRPITINVYETDNQTTFDPDNTI